MTFILKGIARRAAKRAPMEALTHATISQATGVQGDFRGKPSKRQVTILSEESWKTVEQEYGAPLDWLIRRANLLVAGITFNHESIGNTLTIGQVVLEITKECDPCYRMDEQVKGLQKRLTPAFTGGVCCKVIRGGSIHLGDQVILGHPRPPKLI